MYKPWWVGGVVAGNIRVLVILTPQSSPRNLTIVSKAKSLEATQSKKQFRTASCRLKQSLDKKPKGTEC